MLKLKTYDIIFVSSLIYFFAIYAENTLPGGQLLLLLPLGIMCLLNWKKESSKIKINTTYFLLYSISFIIFCMCSKLWSEKPNLSTPKINALVFIFIAMFIVSNSLAKYMDIEGLLKVFMYGGHFVVIYCFIRYGIGNVFDMLNGGTRISNELLNANSIGMCAAYAIVINIYFVMYDKLRLRDVLMLPSIIILLVSQSRKALLLVVLGVVGIYILKNIGKRFSVNTLLKFIIGFFVLIFILYMLVQLPFLESYMARIEELLTYVIEGTGRKDIRFKYIELGLELFSEHPLLGIGIANANIYTKMYYGNDHYLHNNYVELLACGGIIGFLIYYSFYFYLIYSFIKFRKYRDKEYDICLILLLIVLIMDYGLVSYYSRTTYMYMLLFYLEVKKLNNKSKLKKICS